MKTVWVSREFAVPADRLFAHILSYDVWAELEPEGPDLNRFAGRELRHGDRIETPFAPFGLLTWTVEVVQVDRAARLVKTEQRGGPVRRLAHTISVTPLSAERCRCDDHAVIDAGFWSGLIAGRVKAAAETRQAHRAALLEND